MSNNNVFFPDDDKLSPLSDDDELSEDFISDNHSNGSIILEDNDPVSSFFLNDDNSIPSDLDDENLEDLEPSELSKKDDDLDKFNPVYNSVSNDFTLCDNVNILNQFMMYYSDKDQIDNSENQDINIETDIDYQIKKANTWSEFLYYYWIGLTDNIKHKRKYLEYCNKYSNLMKKLEIVSRLIKDESNITSNLSEKTNTLNYFKIQNLDINTIDPLELFSEGQSKRILIEIEGIFKLLDKFLEEYIIFMKNAKGPIGNFIDYYKKIKANCLKQSKINDNKIFNNARCLTEIKLHKANINNKLIWEKFKKDLPEEVDKYKKEFESDFEKDNLYIQNAKFLKLFKKWIKNYIKRKNKEDNYPINFVHYQKYCNRQYCYFDSLHIIKNISSHFEGNKNPFDSIDMLNKYVSEHFERIKNQFERNKPMGKDITESNIKELKELAHNFKESIINKDEYIMTYYDGIIKNSCCWKNRNVTLIKDLQTIIQLLDSTLRDSLDEDKEKAKQILKMLAMILLNLNNFLDIETKFEKNIFDCSEKNVKYNPSLFSEKEIWWFYFVYNISNQSTPLELYDSLIHKVNKINCSSISNLICKLNPFHSPSVDSSSMNHDIESNSDSKEENTVDKPIESFLESRKYLYHKEMKCRPMNPNTKNFRWTELEFNPDKVEYSKRQFKYRKYMIEKLNDEEINNQKNMLDKYNESLVRKHFVLDCLENLGEVLNELEKMGEFIKEGVLLNDQLFFKFILFGINILIFIGQYFWDNHVEPSINN